MRKIKIYASSPMKHIDTLRKALENLPWRLDRYELRIPQMIMGDVESFVHADILSMIESDILVCHIPEPSVGSCAELGFFKAKKPNNPIIAYKCINHPWINVLADYHTTNEKQLIETIECIYNAM